MSGWSSRDHTQKIAQAMNCPVIDVSSKQFNDKEIKNTIEENVRGRDVVVVASGAGDPNKQEKEARLLLRAATRSGAKSNTLYLPYMYYGRADDVWDERNAPGLIDTIETLRQHCDNVVVADPHNPLLTRETFLSHGSRVKSCTIAHFAFPFAVQLKQLFNERVMDQDNVLLTLADTGASKRLSRSFRAGIYNPLGIMDRNPNENDWAQGLKDRDPISGKSKVMGFSADVTGKDVAVFEDMMDSGGTACDLAELLKAKGARTVSFFATTGLFTPDPKGTVEGRIDRLNNSKIDAVFITDTYDHSGTEPAIHKAIQESPVVHVINTAPYMGAILHALHADAQDEDFMHEPGRDPKNDNSISALMRGIHQDQVRPDQTMAVATKLKAGSPLLGLR